LRATFGAISVAHMKVMYLIPVLSLAACSDPAWQLIPTPPEVVEEAAVAVDPPVTLDPTPPPPPPPAARTVEESLRVSKSWAPRMSP